MEYKLKEYSIFEAGQRTDAQGRPQQEDCIYPPHGVNGDGERVFVVCDGMGGHDAGEVASSIVCDAISRSIKADSARGGSAFGAEELQQAISYAYDELDRADTGAEKKMGTTLALLKLYDGGYFIAHIGDSRVYHVRPGKTPEDTEILYRTEDHSLVNYLVRIGKMTQEEAIVSPKRHVITRAMQPNMERRSKADIYQGSDIRPGDYFMLCTDGILEQIDDDYIRYLFSHDTGNAKNKVNLLGKMTAGNNDNHSAIIVHITDVEEPKAYAEAQVHEAPTPESTIEGKAEARRAGQPTEMTNKPDNMDKTDDKRTAKRPRAVSRKANANGDMMELLLKYLFIVMGLVVVIMLIYYLFVRSDENLQRAGTAVDAVIENGSQRDETYGYEITQQDIINVGQEIAPEAPEPTDEVIADAVTDEATTAAEPVAEPTDAGEPEPILQE